MFTVKVWEARNQTETVFEATQIDKRLYEDPDPQVPEIGIVRCDTDYGPITYSIRAELPAEERKLDDRQVMYVMNRFGATVAKYEL